MNFSPFLNTCNINILERSVTFSKLYQGGIILFYFIILYVNVYIVDLHEILSFEKQLLFWYV